MIEISNYDQQVFKIGVFHLPSLSWTELVELMDETLPPTGFLSKT